MILSTREYASRYAGNCSRKTVIRKIHKGLLPTTHKAKKIGRTYVIEVGELDHLKDYDITLKKKVKRL